MSLERCQEEWEHKVPIHVSPVVGFSLETLYPQLVDPRRRGCSGWHHPTSKPPSWPRSQTKLLEKTHTWHEAGAAPGPCRTLPLLPALPATAERCGAALLFLSSPSSALDFEAPGLNSAHYHRRTHRGCWAGLECEKSMQASLLIKGCPVGTGLKDPCWLSLWLSPLSLESMPLRERHVGRSSFRLIMEWDRKLFSGFSPVQLVSLPPLTRMTGVLSPDRKALCF